MKNGPNQAIVTKFFNKNLFIRLLKFFNYQVWLKKLETMALFGPFSIYFSSNICAQFELSKNSIGWFVFKRRIIWKFLLKKLETMVWFGPFSFNLLFSKFVLSLSYLRTQSDESLSKAELNKNVGWKSGKKWRVGPVIDISLKNFLFIRLKSRFRQLPYFNRFLITFLIFSLEAL